MNTILILQDNSCSLQNNVPDNVQALILNDNVGSHFEEVDSWDETLLFPMWNGTDVVENDAAAAKESERIAREQEKDLLDAITVSYNGNTYNGDYDSFNGIINNNNMLIGKGDTKKLTWYTSDGTKIKLVKDDFDNLADMIEIEREKILDD